jgi:hypothetical protein
MAWTQTQIDELKDAIASGVTSVSINGRMVSYRSLAEMERLLARLEAEVSPVTTVRRPNVRRSAYKEPS